MGISEEKEIDKSPKKKIETRGIYEPDYRDFGILHGCFLMVKVMGDQEYELGEA